LAAVKVLAKVEAMVTQADQVGAQEPIRGRMAATEALAHQGKVTLVRGTSLLE
tara:strand:- start:341 stop:499 length:159 start_codon:yes stop_codon:yes gene_type:complete